MRYTKINMFIILTLLEHITHFCVQKYTIIINSHPISRNRAPLINFLEIEELTEHNDQAQNVAVSGSTSFEFILYWWGT